MKISRQNLREKAVEVVRQQILAGSLEPGQVLREESLSAALGVSRTPLREALLELSREGLTQKRAGHGFVVSPLEAREAAELYPLRALLESEALRQAGVPSPARIAELTDLNRKLGAESPGREWIHLDNSWHELLVEACDNRQLLSFVNLLRALTLRYELAFVTGLGDPAISASQHVEILRQLADDDLEAACRTLSDNMTVGLPPLLAWLGGGVDSNH